ncbi:MAG: tetratricopeptide repeat protein, partial [Erysipelotrichales bacterium]|nr:tetratricopeptide repeat protein [Erysipelotrichales bacterium]
MCIRNTKRMLSLLLSLAICITFTGCGESTNTPPDPIDPLQQSEQDLIKQIEDLAKEQQVVHTELDKDSIGANSVLLATLEKNNTQYEYQLNAEDFTTSFELEERESDNWTPFIGSKDTQFTVSDDSIIEYEAVRKTISFTASKEGECVITAISGDKSATAYVKVYPLEDEREGSNSVGYYMAVIATELQPLDEVQRGEYMLSLADYVAIQQASSHVDGNLINAMAAATLMYPTSYMINNYASLLMDQQQYEEALLWLEQANTADPRNPVILTNIAECNYELGQKEKAMSYAQQAINSQKDFGLAHLLQAIIYLERGDREAFIESLFRSAKTCWSEVTTYLMRELYDYVVEYRDRNDVMLITKEHLEILMEAVGYGTEGGPDSIDGQKISLPFPAPVTSAALTAEESYSAMSSSIGNQIDELYGGQFKYYESSSSHDDQRHRYIALFHIVYYEHLIEEKCGSNAYMEEYKAREARFYEDANSMAALADEQIAEMYGEFVYHAERGTASMLIAPFDDSQDWMAMAEESALWLQENTEEMFEEILKIQLQTVEAAEDMWHTTLLQLEEIKMQGYEKNTRPILEEYYEKMYKILSHATDDAMRKNFEKRVLWMINHEGIEVPLGYAGADRDDVNRYYFEKWALATQLESYKAELLKAQNQEVQANAQHAQLERAKARRQQWGDNYSIGLPPLSPIQVHIGMNDGNLTYGYGAFGHTIMYERNSETGTTTQTITSTVNTGIFGLAQLNQTVDDIGDFIGLVDKVDKIDKSLSTLENLSKFAKGTVIGGLPSFEGSETSGSINVYNRDGELIDSSRVNSRQVGASWGLLGGSVESTTTQKARHNGYLTNSFNSSTKVKINLAGFSMEREVEGSIQ